MRTRPRGGEESALGVAAGLSKDLFVSVPAFPRGQFGEVGCYLEVVEGTSVCRVFGNPQRNGAEVFREGFFKGDARVRGGMVGETPGVGRSSR